MAASLASRVAGLIRQHFDGSVSAGAQAYGVPQPTLFRIVGGKSESPRVGTLRRIADYHRTTIDWLLKGEGADPGEASAYPLREWQEFDAVLRSLDLPDAVYQRAIRLPGEIGTAFDYLCTAGLDSNWVPRRGKLKVAAWEGAWKAKALLLKAWTTFLRGLVSGYGKAAVGTKLASEPDLLALGFQPFAIFLLFDGALPSNLDELFARHTPAGLPTGWSMHTVPPNRPKRPPLEAKNAERQAIAEREGRQTQ